MKRAAVIFAVVLGLGACAGGCKQDWDTTEQPLRDQELEAAFFAGLNEAMIPDVPEPKRLRPCCVFGNDVGVEIATLQLPGYEVQNIVSVDELGTHTYNNGMLSLQQPQDGQGIITDEASGILYTCRGGFIDIAHVRDNADRTFYLAAQLARLPPEGGTIPLADEGGARRVVVHAIDADLVRAHGIRNVVTALAEWLDFQASIWHEIATWFGWSSTSFSEQPSAFSPEDLYSNLLGLKIAGEAIRRHAAGTEYEYNRTVTLILRDALAKLGPLPVDGSRLAFEHVDGIWWDSTKRVPDNQLVRHRYFNIGAKLYPWKLVDALLSESVLAGAKDYNAICGGNWTPLGLTSDDRLDGTPFRQMATLEIRPDATLSDNGFVFPWPDRSMITQEDFPAIVQGIAAAADAMFGQRAGFPAARADEAARKQG